VPYTGICRSWSSLAIALLTVGLGLLLGASASHAQSGSVQIKGKRYIDGVETKVKCDKNDGHVLDVTVQGTKVFTLVDTPDCTIFTDTPGDSGVLTFTGKEDVIKNQFNIIKARYIFSGAESGGLVAGAAEGILQGQSEMARSTFTKDKGTLTYSYEDEFGRNIVFVGKYKGKLN
jgi:hypothetical protein